MSKAQYIAAGTIACPQCKGKILVHWNLLQQGIDPQCPHCGLVLTLERQTSAEALAAAAKLNDAFVVANKHQKAALPPRRS
jgi:uncharacterized paraquat-inducible protein A